MSDSKPISPGFNLALSGGGARACIHIGFYEELQKNNIPIAGIAGTSMGSIIGAAIALGFSPEKIRKFALKYLDLNLFSIKNFNFFNESLMKRDDLTRILDELFGDATFADTKIPFACSAVDLENRKEVVFREGSIARAVEASSAYPLVFPPIFYQSRYLIDGGLLDEVPAGLARAFSAHPLIAVRVMTNSVRQYISGQIYLKYYKKTNQSGVFDTMKSTVTQTTNDFMKFYRAPEKKAGVMHAMKRLFTKTTPDFRFLIDIVLEGISIAAEENVKKTLAHAKPEILLEPIVDIGLLEFAKIDEAIEQGRELAIKAMPRIKELL